MSEPRKTCSNCRAAYPDQARPKYTRCAASVDKESNDASLAGEMRKGACGPEAKLWEPIDGKA